MMWTLAKKSTETALQDLVKELPAALGGSLSSILMYGSKASGEYSEDRSDVNLFILLEDASLETLSRLSEPLRVWMKAGNSMPVFVARKELQLYADSLPIEFLDMQDHHDVLFGSDPLLGLRVNRANLRAQCAQELSVKQLKLRQAILIAQGNPKKLRAILVQTLPSILTLYRAVLRIESDVSRGPKIHAALELSKRVGFDGESLEHLSQIHIRRQTDNVADQMIRYLDSIERVLAYLHRK